MVNCLICNKKLGMITESHMKKFHKITCKDYASKFKLKKGELNQQHSKKMTGEGNPRYGIVMPQKLRNKIRRIHKESGRFKGEGNPMFGKTHTPEVKKFLSEHLKGIMIGKNNPFYGKKHTEETKAKLSKNKKELFKKHPEKHINAIMAKRYKKQKNKKGGYISNKQIEIYKIIKNKFKDAKLNYPIITEESTYFADIGIPSLRLDFEYDSEYWHRKKSKEVVRDHNIRKNGWTIVRIDDNEIEKQDKDRLGNYVFALINSAR